MDMRGFAVIVCIYSSFEFLVKRVSWARRDVTFNTKRTILQQSVTLLGVECLLSLSFFNTRLFLGLMLLTGAYALSEYVIERGSGTSKSRALELFLAKQLWMIGLIFVVWQWAMPLQPTMWYRNMEERFLLNDGLYQWWQQHGTDALLIASAYAFVIDGGTKIVRGILDKFPGLYRKAMASQRTTVEESETLENENAGEWIGVLERLITLTFVLTGNFTAIAFALTAKSIARFKELENKDFSEYYLLGTTGSLIAAVAAGMIVKIILGG